MGNDSSTMLVRNGGFGCHRHHHNQPRRMSKAHSHNMLSELTPPPPSAAASLVSANRKWSEQPASKRTNNKHAAVDGVEDGRMMKGVQVEDDGNYSPSTISTRSQQVIRQKRLASATSSGGSVGTTNSGAGGCYIKRREQQQQQQQARRKQSALLALADPPAGRQQQQPTADLVPKLKINSNGGGGGGETAKRTASSATVPAGQRRKSCSGSSTSSNGSNNENDEEERKKHPQQQQQASPSSKGTADDNEYGAEEDDEGEGSEKRGSSGRTASEEAEDETAELLSPLSPTSGGVLASSKSHHHHHHYNFPHLTMASAKNWMARHRKESVASCYTPNAANGTISSNSNSQFQQKRNRSASLCAAQMKADCQAIAAISYQHALNGGGNGGGGGGTSGGGGIGGGAFGRKYSTAQGVMPPLTRLRIQQCFRNAKPAIGHHILKRASALRSEFKSFIGHLREEKVDELANDIYKLVTECVAHVELPSKVAATSFAFGEMHAQLCNLGFRPDFFSVIADATIAECVRLDGGTQKRCEALMAWSQLMQFMFSNVRDGYYAEVRQQRRSSLPQQRLLLKQASIAKQQKQQQPRCEAAEYNNTGNGSGNCASAVDRRRMVMAMQQGISFDMNI